MEHGICTVYHNAQCQLNVNWSIHVQVHASATDMYYMHLVSCLWFDGQECIGGEPNQQIPIIQQGVHCPHVVQYLHMCKHKMNKHAVISQTNAQTDLYVHVCRYT